MIETENITTTEIPLKTAEELLDSPNFRDRNTGICMLLETMTESSLKESADDYRKGFQLAVNATNDENYTVQYAAVELIGNVLKHTQDNIKYIVDFHRAVFALDNIIKHEDKYHKSVVLLAKDKWDSIIKIK
jgi:hypothetical protein